MKNLIQKNFFLTLLFLLIFACRPNKKNLESSSNLLLESSSKPSYWETECLITSIEDLDILFTKEKIELGENYLIQTETFYDSNTCENKLKSGKNKWSYTTLSSSHENILRIKLENHEKSVIFYEKTALAYYKLKHPDFKGEISQEVIQNPIQYCKTFFSTIEKNDNNKNIKFFTLSANEKDAFPEGFLPFRTYYR